MGSMTVDEIMPLMLREARSRAGTLLSIFCFVSLVFIAISFFWQKKYTSYVQLYVDDSAVIAPIIGTEPVATRDKANLAKQELFALDIVDRILDEVGYTSADTTPAERERARDELTENTIIVNRNNQLLEIAYYDDNPRKAFEVAGLYAELFLQKTMDSSTQETTEAFEFIISQVENYRNALEDSERRLESFQRQHPGISISLGNNVNTRIMELQRDLEQTSLLFAQADQRRKTLQRELRSESSTLVRDFQLGQTRQQITQLQAKIDELSLSYTDDYPDIVGLRRQIEDIKQQASSRNDQSGSASNDQAGFSLGGSTFSDSANFIPVYQQLRSDLARTSAEADSQQSRMEQLRVLLAKEVERSDRTSRVERELAELTRDYEINKKFFEELLSQQENARLTMSLGAEKQGVLYRLHQAANFPARPNGLRFVHIVLAGLVLAVILPFLLLFVFVKLDPRIRTASAITDQLSLPLLTTVPHLQAPNEKPSVLIRPAAILATVAIVCSLYIIVYAIKYRMESVPRGLLS
ncbi:MAG: hypothetical protein AB8B63_22830 [Granulosicoccus sp.]